MTSISIPRGICGYSAEVFFETSFGKFCWNLHTSIWQSTLIEREIRNVSQIAPNNVDEVAKAIFRDCHFEGTWNEDRKLSAIKDALSPKIAQIPVPQPEAAVPQRSVDIEPPPAALAVQPTPQLQEPVDDAKKYKRFSTLLWNIHNTINVGIDLNSAIIKFEKANPEFDGSLIRNLILLKLDQGDQFQYLKIDGETLSTLMDTPAGEKILWDHLSKIEHTEEQVKEIQDRYEIAKKLHDDKTKLNDTFSTFCLSTEIDSAIPVIITQRIIPQMISSFNITEEGSKKRFEIEYPEDLSANLGPEGEKFLRTAMTIKVKRKITGTIDKNSIYFDKGCVSGTAKITGYIHSLCRDPKNESNLKIVVAKGLLSVTQSWDADDFTNAFYDLKWPQAEIIKSPSVIDQKRFAGLATELDDEEKRP